MLYVLLMSPVLRMQLKETVIESHLRLLSFNDLSLRRANLWTPVFHMHPLHINYCCQGNRGGGCLALGMQTRWQLLRCLL